MIDAASVVAIDAHVHAEVSASGHPSLPEQLREGAAAYFGSEHRMPTVAEIAAYYRERRMAAVIFTVDAEGATSHPPISNEEIALTAAEHPDVLVPFASIDPAKGPPGAREARRLAEGFKVRGFKFHPNLQGFFPNDRSAYRLYEAIQELGLPAVFHSGQTGIGARVRGGGGVRLKYSNPMYLDDVAVDFPDLRIVIAHPSFPWQDEALAVATHKPNVYIDLSGWSPKYFPPQLIQYANTLLKDKMLFGSDYPLLTPDRWLADFDTLDIKADVKPRILKLNAMRLLGIG
ncbi:MAG TPA: amidohydrolase family protein [Candidatus Saccharimonadales bacterium]|nr:amidohydrolase family protein [Candidatus Saccharimonadales bacterium]